MGAAETVHLRGCAHSITRTTPKEHHERHYIADKEQAPVVVRGPVNHAMHAAETKLLEQWSGIVRETGVFESLRDPARFAKVAIEFGTVVWPDDGLDMAPEPLYEEASQRQVRGPSAAARAA